MENAKIKNMYDLSQSIAGEYLSQFTYPWEALKGISDFIKKLGPTLDPEIYEKRGENIWVAKSATVAPTACLNGPLIIDEDARSVTVHLFAGVRSLERIGCRKFHGDQK